MLFATIAVAVAVGVVLLVAAYYMWRPTREGLDGYEDYSGNSADEMKVLVYKNAGNVAALKDAVDRLIDTSTDTQGRLTSLEKDHDNLTTVLKETKAIADETKANVDSAVTDYKAQGDQQSNALNDVSFDN